MEESNPLRTTLESLTRVYHHEKISVRFGSPSRAVPAGHCLNGEEVTEPTVVINPSVQEQFSTALSGPEELRCITNTLSHELEHIRESELTSKAEFMQEYNTHPQFAGAVINILEDQYIDFRRTQRFPGLRGTQAFVIDKLLGNDDRWPPIDDIEEPSKAMIEGLRQVAFAGYAKGISKADRWIRDFLSQVRPYLKRVRREPSQQQRVEFAHSVMKIAQEYLPENDDIKLPEKCAVCKKRKPQIITPVLGPVCDECAPTGHGKNDGRRTTNKEASNGCREKSITEPQPTDEQKDVEQTQEDTVGGNKHNDKNQANSSPSQRERAQKRPGELARMDDLDLNQDSAAWWNVPDQVNHQTVNEEDITRYNKIQSEKRRNQSHEVEMRKNRQKSSELNQGLSPNDLEHSTNLQKSKEWRYLREEHRRSFKKLTSRDMSIPSRKGSRVNLSNLVQQTAGDKSQDKLYNKKQRVARGDRVVAVSADFSGSMDGKRVRLAIAAISEATDMVGDKFLATCWRDVNDSTAYGCNRGSSGIGLVCGVAEQFQWSNLDEFQSGGGTPTADGVDVTAQLIKNTSAREKLIIVITDGQPNTEYGKKGEELTGDPTTDAAQVVRDAKVENIKIIGLYVGKDINNTSMNDIFGDDNVISASMENLAEELIRIYRQQLRV